MRQITCKSLLLAALLACSCLLSIASSAAGLGKLTVLSSLGQPLRAEIEIVSLQAGEGDSITARLASPDAFRQANIELNGALLGVQFAIERRAGGRYVLTMSSVQPMNEPFIDALIELNWTGGRLVREYTFLLDPPDYKGPVVAAAPVVAPAAPPVAQVTPVPVAPAPAAAPMAPVEPARPAAAAPSAPRPAAPAKPAGTHEVKRGDTLMRIAAQNQVEGASLQQMLVALYRGNRDAFDGENMNRLRAGRILNLPDREAATATSQADALRMVNAQGSDYANYRRSMGAAVAEAPARSDSGRQASGRIGAPAEQAPSRAGDAGKDQLRLSRAEDAKAGGRAALAAAQDDAAAKGKALKEANERIALLEKNIADLQKLAQLKSQAGAQLQQQAQAGKAEAAKAPAPAPAPAATPAPAAKAVEAPKAPEAATAAGAPKAAAAPEPAKAPDVAKADAPKADAPKADAPKADAPKADVPKAAAPKAAPKAAVAPPPPPPDMLEELTSDPVAIGGAAGVVVLLAGYAFYAVRKRRKLAAANSAVAMAAADTNSMMASNSVDIDTSSSQFEGELSQEGAGKSESEEIDPIAEADVYMAYGRDAQAEEILKEALSKDSSRQPVRLKLLEIYANRKDATSFATEAAILHAATGGTGAEWEKAAGLGAGIDPGNALYGGAAPASVDIGSEDTQVLNIGEMAAADAVPAAEAAPAEIDFDLGSTTGAPVDVELGQGAEAEAPAAPAAEEAAPTTLDFDLDLGGDGEAAKTEEAPAAPAVTDTADAGMSIDFDLPTGEPAAAPELPAEPSPAPAEDGGMSIDFDLGPTAAEATPEPVAEPALDMSSISLDLGSPSTEAEAPAPDAHWQEVATKLDLAKAYQEMGDKDGAKELLNEVLKEGDAAQQEQARTVLETLG